VFSRDQQCFALARAALRGVLGEALGMAPESLRFDYGAHGKPALAGAAAGAGLAFNLSHSGALALVGLMERGQIGVDVEAHRAMTDRDALVRRFFSPAENAAYVALDEADRQRAYFDGWTRKEAVVKALGQGLSFPLRSFDVSLAAAPGALLRLRDRAAADAGWCLAGFEPAPGHSAAVVVPGRDCRLSAVR
jgi:4'-phosphopantetheinyl transferase